MQQMQRPPWRRLSDAIQSRVGQHLRRSATSSAPPSQCTSIYEDMPYNHGIIKPTVVDSAPQSSIPTSDSRIVINSECGIPLDDYRRVLEESGMENMQHHHLMELCAHYIVHSAGLKQLARQLQRQVEDLQGQVAVYEAYTKLSAAVQQKKQDVEDVMRHCDNEIDMASMAASLETKTAPTPAPASAGTDSRSSTSDELHENLDQEDEDEETY